MKKLIYASLQNPGTIINKIGKYLKKNIDGAFKIEFGPMECDVTMMMYYQVPHESDTLHEMNFIISLTSYSNKVRVNLTEDTPLEKTIGQVILDELELNDLSLAKKKILTLLKRSIAKEYKDYDFVY